VKIDLRSNPKALSNLMEFDHAIRVDDNGEVFDDVAAIWAPTLCDGELDTESWSLLDGYSGQDRYSGPMMHQSEFIGGRMARDILDTPGIYVALVNYQSDGVEPTEWAVARMEEE
jgi:hypothetical protein